MPSITTQSVSREIIENKLLAALDDAATVAILATKEDLCLLIEALAHTSGGPEWMRKTKAMADDLNSLRLAAFPH